MIHAGILLEGLKYFDAFSFGKASYILEGVKPEIISQKARIVHEQRPKSKRRPCHHHHRQSECYLNLYRS
jgi:hypothetical protein